MPLPAGSMRRDIASAYLAIGARIGGLFVVSAAVYRALGIEAFALLNLIRSTVGLLNYTGLGLAPAMVRMLAEARGPARAIPLSDSSDNPGVSPATRVLDYRVAGGVSDDPAARVYGNGAVLAMVLALVGLLATAVYVSFVEDIHRISDAREPAQPLALFLGIALVFRLLSEAPSSALQVSGRVALDNLLVAATELAAAVSAAIAVIVISQKPTRSALATVGLAYASANCLLLFARIFASRKCAPDVTTRGVGFDLAMQRALLGFGALVTAAQLADFLYAPTDYILINQLLDLEQVGVYAPAVQIDAGLLTLVTGLGAVLLPKTAVAHTAGEIPRVRRYYLRGTLASTTLLAGAALGVWALSPWLLRLWLGHDMPATRAILPLVLIHTVVGGSGAVGRSILLGMGKVKPFTASVLIAGIANVLLSYVFVQFFGMGLRGIVVGTIVAVVARAGLWTPWYVLRTLKRAGAGASAGATPAASGRSSPTSG